MKKFFIGLVLFFITSSVFAADKIITLNPGWSTLSTPNILSNISFSNVTGAGISIYKLNNGTWQTVTASTGTITPLEGFMVYNSNLSNIDVSLTYKTGINPQDSLFTKNLYAGWNLLGISTTSNPFSTIGTNATMCVDFTKNNGGSNFLNKLAGTFSNYIGNSNISNVTPELGESYGIFMSQTGVYGGSQDLNTVVPATLTMTRNDGMEEQSVIIGSSIQTLTQFSMSANNSSDLSITELMFTQTGTSNVNSANVTNVRLIINGTTVSIKNMTSGAVNFNDINVSVLKNSSVTVKVVADFSVSIIPGQFFQLGLSSINAIDSNANTLTSGFITLPLNGPLYTFVGEGTATFTLNSSTPTASMLTPAASEMEVARYTLSATNDSLKLTDLYVRNNGTSDLSANIKSIGLYDTNGTKLAGGSVLGTGTVQFALGGGSTFIIPKNTSNSVVVVKVAFNDVTDASQTNKTVRLAVGVNPDITQVSGAVNGARLVSDTTGNEVTSITSGAAISNTHLLVRSKPVVAINAAATESTHTFSVTADSNNRITILEPTFSITNPTATGGTFTLYKDFENAGNIIGSGTINFAGNISFNGFIPTEVSAGSTKTFIFKTNLFGSAPVNSKRIFQVEDVSYIDMMNTGGDVTIPSINNYNNVGFPSVQSVYTY